MRKIIAAVIIAFALGALLVVPRADAQSPASENPCPFTVRLNGASSSTQILTGNGTNTIRICFYSLSLSLTSGSSAQYVWGTGSTCGSNTTDLSPKISQGSTVTGTNYPIAAGNGYGFIDENPTRGVSNLCLIASGSSPTINGVLKYGLY